MILGTVDQGVLSVNVSTKLHEVIVEHISGTHGVAVIEKPTYILSLGVEIGVPNAKVWISVPE